ncbi:MAG TPA: phosphopantetheine-binding protein [Longimicrobiales bacterium]|nr:phosphopantetheine-binding protein [Longimicrobiales bacterium]
MNEQNVLEQARNFVVENFMYMRKVKTIGDDESLLRTGVISSLGMMEVVEWVEGSFGMSVDPDEITEQNFDTLRGIARFVASKANVQAA